MVTEPYAVFAYSTWPCDGERLLIMPLTDAAIVSGVNLLKDMSRVQLVAIASVPFRPSLLIAPSVDSIVTPAEFS